MVVARYGQKHADPDRGKRLLGVRDRSDLSGRASKNPQAEKLAAMHSVLREATSVATIFRI
jgi:hypothetical protein